MVAILNVFLVIVKTNFFQQKIGVPLEGKVRVQLNLKVKEAPQIQAVKEFRNFVFPIMWLEEVIIDFNANLFFISLLIFMFIK